MVRAFAVQNPTEFTDSSNETLRSFDHTSLTPYKSYRARELLLHLPKLFAVSSTIENWFVNHSPGNKSADR